MTDTNHGSIQIKTRNQNSRFEYRLAACNQSILVSCLLIIQVPFQEIICVSQHICALWSSSNSVFLLLSCMNSQFMRIDLMQSLKDLYELIWMFTHTHTHLTSQKQTLAHVGNTDHETWLSLVIGHDSVLTEFDSFSSLLRPSYLHQT